MTDKYFVSEAPEGNMPADGLDTPQRKATTITVKAFFSGYMLAGMGGQEFAQLTPEQQLQARIDFLHDRASHIAGLPAGQVKREAARMVCSLDAAQGAVEAGDISNAAMHFLDAGRFMERVTSSQLAGISLELKDQPNKAIKAKIIKLEIARNQVIENWLSKPRRRGERKGFSIDEAHRLKQEKAKSLGVDTDPESDNYRELKSTKPSTIYDWLAPDNIQKHKDNKK